MEGEESLTGHDETEKEVKKKVMKNSKTERREVQRPSRCAIIEGPSCRREQPLPFHLKSPGPRQGEGRVAVSLDPSADTTFHEGCRCSHQPETQSLHHSTPAQYSREPRRHTWRTQEDRITIPVRNRIQSNQRNTENYAYVTTFLLSLDA